MSSVLSQKENSSPVLRIGAAIGPHDPYWVQVRETVYKRVYQLGLSPIPLEISDTNEALFSLDPASLAEEVLAQDLDAVVCQTLPLGTIYQLVYNNLPVIFLGESQLQHRLFCSPTGLYEVGQIAAKYIAEKIGYHGRVLCVGGLLDLGEDKGISRLTGFRDQMHSYPGITVLHCPTAWRYDQAYPLAYTTLRELGAPIDAIYGISDSLALAARDAGYATGVISPKTVIVGTNGDPLALAAIIEGSFSATIETSAEDLGASAVNLAIQAARGIPLPRHYTYTVRVITSENVAECAARKLVSIADLPSRLVGVNREEERYRLVQLESGAAINRSVGLLLDRRQLTRELSNLLCSSYSFDYVQYFRWFEKENLLFLDGQEQAYPVEGIPLEQAGLLGEAIRRRETIFIPDIGHSNRFLPDPNWPETRARVVMPVRLGDELLGLLDMHSRKPIYNLRWDLIGLQALADQFAIALRNADLYSQALESREIAERANQLKTRLLANVSHELRTPLNVILGYSQAAMSSPNPYGVVLPDGLLRDLRYIYQSGEHLIRIINDLLDLSRAEIGELNVFPEPLDVRPLLKETLEGIAKTRGKEHAGVTWEFRVPRRLPVINADPVRLRQILLNLLSNACKFTESGQITLGAEVEPPYLHIWVSDSGAGIPIEQQERIFEPFVTSDNITRRREGIGLGLSITRRLVALHGGSMSLESQPGAGSVFHIYWPLPNLSGELVIPRQLGARPALLVLSTIGIPDSDNLPQEIRSIAARQNLEICLVHEPNTLEDLLKQVQPAAIAWDMYNAVPGEWNIIQRLYTHPLLNNLPLILFGQDTPCGPGIGSTNLLLKPFSGRKLVDLIESLRPAEAAGTVLVVDDDSQAGALYRSLIEEALPGFPILHLLDGEQAQQYLEENTPALVILDLIMPKVNGFQVLESLRSNPRSCRVPVIVLSGKLLNFDDVTRLNFPNVVFHSKGLLSTGELIDALQQTLTGETKLGQPTSRMVKQSLAYLHQNYDHSISRSELADTVGVSENYLNQIFQQELGLSPLECLNRLRILKAQELLGTSNETITMIASKVGFEDPAYFSRVFRKLTGKSPKDFRQGR